MKEVKTFIIVELIIAVIKIIGGIVCHSFAMIASSLLDISLVLVTLAGLKAKENNKKYKGILTSILGLIIILGSVFLVFASFIVSIKRTSLWILIFLVISLFIRYIVGCFFTNMSYQRKKGLLNFGNLNSNVDFINYGIILLGLILMKVSKWVVFLKYADRVATIAIALVVAYKGIKIIMNSFKVLEDKEVTISDEYVKEITDRSELKKLYKLDVINYGGVRVANCGVILKDNITLVDVNTFVVTLQDYLLKIADVACVYLVEPVKAKKNKPKVRSLKQDARNSGSRNSKTNTKKKNTTKKNKKR